MAETVLKFLCRGKFYLFIGTWRGTRSEECRTISIRYERQTLAKPFPIPKGTAWDPLVCVIRIFLSIESAEMFNIALKKLVLMLK
jgi:hypothetical protein